MKYCFYHSADLDGKCSGAIVLKYYKDIKCVPINYDYPEGYIRDMIEDGDTVVMVDFSATPEDMEWLREKQIDFIWIDHHKTSIDVYDREDIAGIRRVGEAGCELTWEYFYLSEFMPKAVFLLGRYDVWDHKDDSTLPFQYGARAQELDPYSSLWDTLLYMDYGPRRDTRASEEQRILREGETIYSYQISQNKIFAKGIYEIYFRDLRTLVINRSYTNSQVFDSVYDPEKHDAMLTYAFGGKLWHYSMYSTKPEIDVSKIAKIYGGGGHKGASGFSSTHNIVENYTPVE